MTEIKVQLLNEEAKLPTIATEGSACSDLYSTAQVTIPSFTISKVPTGIAIELPSTLQAKIFPRSGLSSKGIVAVTGTIDSDYRGEISVMLHNTTNEPYVVNIGDRIAQMDILVNTTNQINFIETAELSETTRGSKGFGSTGV